MKKVQSKNNMGGTNKKVPYRVKKQRTIKKFT